MGTMAKSIIFCFSLLLINAPDRVDGFSLGQLQYLASRQEVKNNAGALASCAKRATDELFEPTHRIVVIFDDKNSSGIRDESTTVNDFMKIISKELSTVGLASSSSGNAKTFLDPYSAWHGSDRYPSYVIISNDLENLMEIFGMGRKSSTWLEYLIVTRIDEDSVNILAESLLERGYIRVAFVHAENNESPIWLRRYDATVNFPSGSTKLKKLATCRDTSKISSGKDFDATSTPLAKTLCPSKHCHVTAAHVSDEMVGSALIGDGRGDFDCAVRVIGFFIVCKQMHLRHRINYDKNLNWSKTVELIERDKIDVAYGSFIPRTVKAYNYIDAAAWFDFETITFVDTSKFIVEAPLTKLFVPLDAFVWLCILTLLVIYTIFAILVQKAHRRKLIKESISSFHIWTILLGQGMNLPINIGLRTMLGMWMIAALLINAAYGSAFKSSLAKFKKINALRTLHDLSQSGRPIVGTASTRQLFNNSDDEDDRRIFERWRTVEPEEILKVIKKERVVGVDYSFNIKLYNMIRPRRYRPRLYSLQEPILVYPLYFYLKKYHPYTKPLREIVFRTSAAGLIHKETIDMIYNAHSQSRERHYWRTWAHRKRTVRELIVSFKTWAVGLSISFITFLYELYRNKRRHSLKKIKTNKISKTSINIERVEIDFRQRGKQPMRLTIRNFPPARQRTLY